MCAHKIVKYGPGLLSGGPAPRTPPKFVWVIISPPGVNPPCYEIYYLLVSGYCWSNILSQKQACMHTVMLLSSFFTDHRGTVLGWWMRAPCIRWNYQSHWQAMCAPLIKASIGRFHLINTLQTNEPESFKLPGHTNNNWQGRFEVVEVMEDTFLDISSDFKTFTCFWCDF